MTVEILHHSHNHGHENRPDENCKDVVPTMEFTGFGKAYVPHQKLCELYPAKTGFMRGTIFPELDIPYENRQGQKSGEGGDNIE